MRVVFIGFLCLSLCLGSFAMKYEERISLRDKAKEMFQHAITGYMEYAFPDDELNPVTCQPITCSELESDCVSLGNFSLTLIDSLDTIAIIEGVEAFNLAVKKVIKTVTFKSNNKVSVFEVNIRILGGLLSAHLLAINKELGYFLPDYRGELLTMAIELGDILMQAFDNSPLGFPCPAIRFLAGVDPNERKPTSPADSGTFILEFGVLSRLTGNPKYEKAAKKAIMALWKLRNKKKLLSSSFDWKTGAWVSTHAGIGSGLDSFYEYLLKAHILFLDEDYLTMFREIYQTAQTWLVNSGYFPMVRDINNNNVMYAVDGLAAFWPGMQVLYGELEPAIRMHMTFSFIWKKFSALPEGFDLNTSKVYNNLYLLRPELVESTYFLYQATKDPFYLKFGKRMLEDIDKYCRTNCGFTVLQNVQRKQKGYKMESYFLSETLKYLYLLFDHENYLNKWDGNFVFTTEAHLFVLPQNLLNTAQKGNSSETSVCSKFHRSSLSINHRADVEWVRSMVDENLPYEEPGEPLNPYGFCVSPF